MTKDHTKELLEHLKGRPEAIEKELDNRHAIKQEQIKAGLIGCLLGTQNVETKIAALVVMILAFFIAIALIQKVDGNLVERLISGILTIMAYIFGKGSKS